jgi:2-oxoglutarate ferredoxin oxidoreductase subunit gamma
VSQTEIIVSGFGGQGTLLAGHVLAEAGLKDEMHVTWLPSYGPEMRGGTAHCTVILSDEPIGAPIVSQPKVALAMNKPSVTKYEALVKPEGLLIVNSSLVPEKPQRGDIQVLMIPATEEAEALGNGRMANSVMLGALLATMPLVGRPAIEAALEKVLAKKKDDDLVTSNLEALARGEQLVKERQAAT